MEIEHTICQIAEEMVMLEAYPRADLNIVVHVLESDGYSSDRLLVLLYDATMLTNAYLRTSIPRSLICAIINALCLALINAGVSMYDMVVACSVGYVGQQFCVDVTQVEQNSGGAFLPVVIKAQSEDIIFMQLDSRLSLELLDDAMAAGIGGCKRVQAYMEAAIRKDTITHT